MPWENGVHWKPIAPDQRGRHETFNSALDTVVRSMFAEISSERNAFFDSLADVWDTMFPDCPARPGRYEDGKIFLYVPSAPVLFAMRMKLGFFRTRLAALPGAPKKLVLRLEIHVR